MKSSDRALHRELVLLVILSLAAGVSAAQDAASNKEQKDDAAGFKEFTDRAQEYIDLSKEVEKTLPALKSKEELPEMIVAHQQALARKIREARPHAKRGDIFTRDSREAFQHVTRSAFEDSHVTAHTVRQKDATKTVRLRVNGVYPDAVAETAVPPTLLQKLPTLPDGLAYRIVGRDLVLVDIKASLVVDLFHKALPKID